MDASPHITELDASASGLRALERFYRESYVAEFPDANERESLANMRRYLKLAAQGWYGANNYHILVAWQEGRPVGGAVLDYLAGPSAGVIEFIFTDRALRGRGLGRRLLDAGEQCLRADARRHSGRLRAVVAEMNDPYQRTPTPDNMDPFQRATVWGRWGFSKLDFPYVQPALSAQQAAVECLTFVIRPLRPARRTHVPAPWLREIVADYLRWAMRIPEPETDPYFRAMAAFLAHHRRIALTPLSTYIGHDPQRPFEQEEIDDRHAQFGAVVALARRAIPQPGRAASMREFSAALAAAHQGGPAYHLWRLGSPGTANTAGMASFFTLPSAGFGGYIVLAGELRGRGLLALVIARIEKQMMADSSRAEGWFIECGDDSAAVFLRAGFAEVPAEYRPPPVGTTAAGANPPERLHLLYKPFGTPYPPVDLSAAFVLRAIRDILSGIYGVAVPYRHVCYRLFRHTLNSDGGIVRMQPLMRSTIRRRL